MLISKIASTSTFLGRIGYTETDYTLDTPIVQVKLSPRLARSYQKTFVDGSYRMTASTFASSIGGLFKYYRGGMQVTFEFVFSKMHTQRFRVVYVPPATSVPNDLAAQSNCLSTVFSANGYTKKTFTIPFVSEDFAIDMMKGETIGTLALIPISNLTTPYATTNVVYVNTYICCTPECEFFVLNPGLKLNYSWPKYEGSSSTDYGNEDKKDIPLMELEGLDQEPFDDSGNPVIFQSTAHQVGDNLTGENIRSVKDIIQRFIRYNGSISNKLLINTVSSIVSAPSRDFPGSAPMPLFHWFCLLFRFRDGGINIAFPRKTTESMAARVNMNTGTEVREDMFGIVTNPSGSDEEQIMDNMRAGGLFVPNITETTLVFKAPYFNNNLYSYNNPQNMPIILNTHHPYVEIATSDTILERPLISAADDFKFYKLFCPPTIYTKL
jgi:hypothetical protein